MLTTAREIMHAGVTCIDENETLETAAQRMRELDIGALPICGEHDQLQGIVTDRDIVIKCIGLLRPGDRADVLVLDDRLGLPRGHAAIDGHRAPVPAQVKMI